MKLAWVMMPVVLLGVAAGVAAAAAPPGAVVGKSGFATIARVPPSPTSDVRSERPTYNGPIEWYAQEEGLTIPEARKRISEQMGFVPIFERLQERLRRLEPDNYVSARIEHQPDWHYVLFFKRDPEATLRRYSVNPRFKVAKAAYTEAELRTLAAPWLKRFGDAGIVDVHGMDTNAGRVSMTIPITRGQYDAIAAREGWGEVPATINLHFAAEHPVPRVDPRVAPLLRGFASASRATTLQMERGEGGRVVLDNGCLRLAGSGKVKGPLVVFRRETGIGLDAQGYLAIIDRGTGKPKGRIGEPWVWAGPNPDKEFDGLKELKMACGDGPIAYVGNPESEARFDARYRRSN